jgi:flagellar protein FliO/FliZ
MWNQIMRNQTMWKLKRHFIVILHSLAMVCVPVASWGAETIARPSGTNAMLQTLAGLGVVVALIFALAWMSKRLGGGSLGQNKFMKIIAVQALGAREKIILVDVAGKQMMLGVTPGRIATLHVFDEPVFAVPASGEGGGNLSARSASEFSRKLQEFLSQGNKT